MTTFFNRCCRRLGCGLPLPVKRQGQTLAWMLAIWMATACAHISSPLPKDLAAEKVIAGIQRTNKDLRQFKCMGKIALASPGQPVQSYRCAIAGQLKDHLRVDLFAALGGSSGTVASDGRHVFLVMHASREYYKRRYGDGSLKRFIKMDITVEELLELLVGRIPLDDRLSPRSMPSESTTRVGVNLVDRSGKTRQTITLDASGRPRHAQWFDPHDQPVLSLLVDGYQEVDGFVLPKKIVLSTASGQTASILLQRFEANAPLDDDLFAPPPISS